MRIIKTLAPLIFILMLLCTPAYASEGVLRAAEEASGLYGLDDALGQETRRLLGDTEPSLDVSFEGGLLQLAESGGREASGVIGRTLPGIVQIAAVMVVCGIVNAALCDRPGPLREVTPMAGILAVNALALGGVNSVMGLGMRMVEQLNVFSKTLLPALSAASAASGMPTAAVARHMATVFFSDILITVTGTLMTPLVYAFLVLRAISAASGDETVAKLSELVKWTVTTGTKLFLTVFVAYITVMGAVWKTGDTVVSKTAKFTISASIPVVGGVLSDAAATVVSGAAAVKNAIGIFGLLAILAICVVPFLEMGVSYLMFKASAVLLRSIGDTRVADFVSAISESYGIILGLVGAAGLILMVSVISAIVMVSPL